MINQSNAIWCGLCFHHIKIEIIFDTVSKSLIFPALFALATKA